jgi:spore coat polysaccharide biosynthesis protein SpsF (cytidylyltransferase family)
MHRRQQHATRVLIGIQARSTSKRFPNKGMAMINGKTMTEKVLAVVEDAVSWMRKEIPHSPEFSVALLVPEGDPLGKHYARKVDIVEGDEFDVLSRFEKAAAFYRPDYVVRLTGDCPLIPHYVISKHIRCALFSNTDYLTNGDPRFRTAPDGHDCEVISKRMLRWLSDNARRAHDKEHVTTLAKSDPPRWAKVGNIVGHIDCSQIKLSVDTQEDLERVIAEDAKITRMVELGKTYLDQPVMVFRL